MTSEAPVVDRSAPFAQVLKVVNQFDPENLLAIGAPPDEYDAEVGDLTARIRTGEPMTADVVRAVWEHWFGGECCLSVRMPESELLRFAAQLEEVRLRQPF